MSDTVRLSVDEGLARITLDRPPLNVFTIGMLGDLTEALSDVAGRDDVRLVRLDAAGKVFSAGVDVGDHMGDKLGPMMETFGKLFETYERMPMPTVAVVHGAALGGGCEVALGTDLCVASERATFGQPEIRLGVFAPPASVLLPRLAGERRALGLLLTGESISAGEAALFGVVNKVFPTEGFAEDVDTWFEGLLQLSGAALRQAKRAVVATRNLPLREAHRAVDRIYLDELMQTADANEGLQSFMQKRKPTWKHR